MVAAHELGLADRMERVSTTVSPTTPNDALAPENPLMKVPSLTTYDGQILFDSSVICGCLDSLAASGRLFPAPGPARWAALRQHALGGGILDALILCRYETLRPDDTRWSGWTDGQMTKARQGLAAAEREDLSGPRAIGPLTIGCVLGYLDFRFPDGGWRRRHPKFASWYDAVEKLPSMLATTPAGG